MCGIVAVLGKAGKPADSRALSVATDLLAHRGPDDQGVFVDGEMGLGHRRLSVIDLAGGHQPMRGPSGRTWMVYNGEVFNYRELRKKLEAQGERFKTKSDTEVILALYEREGPSFARHLNGMFAFAIWDERDRSLVLGRDPMGIKPLYIWEGPGEIVAASEVKAILAWPGVPRRLRHPALAEYLVFRQLCGGRTMFADIDAVEPGTVVVVRNGQKTRHVYWTLSDSDAGDGAERTEEAGRALRPLLEDAVRLALVADVPLGVFASGGLDSSLVTALAGRHATERLETFSVGFAEREWDERSHARDVAAQLGTVHHEIVVERGAFADDLPAAIWHHDEPLNHANSVMIKQLARFARERVTVVLTGEGSDELFGGYPRYRLARALEMLRRFGPWPERAIALFSRGRSRKAQLVAACAGKSDTFAVATNARYVLDADMHGLVQEDWLAERLSEAQGEGSLSLRTQRFDQRTYLRNVLQRMDRMTMAFGLEARVPFLDPRIVAFAHRLPAATRMPRMKTKAVVKAAARDVIPARIVNRSKSGFGVPLAEWMRAADGLGPRLDMLSEARTHERGWWNRQRVLDLVDEHRRGQDRSEVLWSLINAELWARLMLDAKECPRPATPRAPSGIATHV